MLAITKPQLVMINRSLNDYIHLRKENELLRMDLQVSDSLAYYWKQCAMTYDTISVNEMKMLSEVSKMNKSLRSDLDKQKKLSRKIGIGVGVGGTLLGVLLGALLIK